ncbi:sigma-54-dependent transcriptional regulator [Rickettsiales endosymbiont of Trichoplax sp. H2]|uniref:sigma-54-dependent transcriptional regulator n=1 Tax=Rickettsiales endosymbiont of Trichoplax sp. H2 TaxID=2021221 RepID=UPI0012B3CE3B|nr:sigma-54 dependent transcriptional regulator [Rickettsiales endosymbiont of Trichoplax sp. H2]MSO14265.1 Transcriptional regulatory protein FlbD [Rickettsiales endosymbiont of Trichoplax sp. H2]
MRLLIIGDLKGSIVNAAKLAKEQNAKILHAIDIKSAMINLRNGENIELIIIDSEMNIKELKNTLEAEHFSVPIVSCGLSNNPKRAAESIKEGAIEYILLPPNKEVIAALFSIISNNSEDDNNLICFSQSMSKIISVAKQIAPSIANVLISGQSGVGKEVIAKLIHKHSKNSQNDLISINCAAIPENLLESEMFGHEKGAFTGAAERRIGKFEQANNSTLFLDEISEMDLKLQAKLLRAIQEKEIFRVGGNKPIKLNMRIIATSNRNLISEVKNGNFREDLFYRLNVIHLEIPPLKNRLEDIIPLSEHFLQKYCKVNNLGKKTLDEKALKKLQVHFWPGNVRELENTIHRFILISTTSKIEEKDISIINTSEEENLESLEAMEKKAIDKALNKYNKNYDLVAKVLGISINTLQNKLKHHHKLI